LRVISVGVPVPAEGAIDIPIIEREVSSPRKHFKMALAPLFRVGDVEGTMLRVRQSRAAHSAVTHYRVLRSSGSAALLELQPLTDMLILGWGWGRRRGSSGWWWIHTNMLCINLWAWCFVLKQKLPEGMLKRLGLTPPKCRYLPLYVHGRQLLVPGPGEGDSSVSETHGLQLNVVSKPPRYFREALRKLGIQGPWQHETPESPSQ
ncbi:mitochondrial RNA pseudouridine synthase rpusd4-like, partial [Chiloscyllium plagiosum]|uniref:mitochondrial RNA pseudouridine synthase rpusd4-like n=1 Tax=Chiloscyllium plagiosum TaxID=36176 RepID=UPI001CB85392